MQKQFVERGKIDYFLTIGSRISDEEMFGAIRYVNQYSPEFFVDVRVERYEIIMI